MYQESNLQEHLAMITVKIEFHSIEILFETDAIDMTKPSNQKYMSDNNIQSLGFPLEIELR